MSIKERKYLYEEVMVDGNRELDFLSTNFIQVNLDSVRDFRIPTVLQYRPDLISKKFYGNFHMGWLIALHNDFMDPIFDFYEGRLIKIPNLDEYFRYYKTNSRRV